MVNDALKLALSQAGQHIGDLVWWELSDAKTERQVLETLWANAGLPQDLLPEKPEPRKAMRNAAKECSAGLKDRLIRLAYERDDAMAYSILDQHWVQGSETMAYVQSNLIKLNDTGAMTEIYIGDAKDDLAMKFHQSYFEFLLTHTTDEVRRCLVRTLDVLGAFALRKNGGFYWVPHPAAEVVRKLKSVVDNLGNSNMEVLPVHDNAEVVATLQKSAKDHLEDRVKDLLDEMEKFSQAKSVRQDTLDRRIKEFQALRDRAGLYSQILGLKVESIEKNVQSMEAMVRTMLSAA